MKRNQKNQAPHEVFVVEGAGDTAFWTKIGAAWPHQDGKGFNIQLECVPLDGRVTLRAAAEKKDQ